MSLLILLQVLPLRPKLLNLLSKQRPKRTSICIFCLKMGSPNLSISHFAFKMGFLGMHIPFRTKPWPKAVWRVPAFGRAGPPRSSVCGMSSPAVAQNPLSTGAQPIEPDTKQGHGKSFRSPRPNSFFSPNIGNGWKWINLGCWTYHILPLAPFGENSCVMSGSSHPHNWLRHSLEIVPTSMTAATMWQLSSYTWTRTNRLG